MFEVFRRFIALIIVLGLLAACSPAGQSIARTSETAVGSAEATPSPGAADQGVPPTQVSSVATTSRNGSLSGDITVDGSSTVEPITLAVAEEFQKIAPDVNVVVGRSGTGGGFEKFCNGETDISNASRAINDVEARNCETNNIEPVEIQIGIDALTVVVNPENEFATCLTAQQIVKVFGEGGAKTWNEVDPAFPNELIKIYAPGADSGTFDYFVEHFKLRGEPRSERAFIANYTGSEDDNVLVQGIEDDRNAIGFFGYSYFAKNKDHLKGLNIDQKGDGTCVAASAATMSDNTYPLARPLFIYPSKAALVYPQVRAFIEFYMSAEGLRMVEQVTYFPAPQDKLDTARSNLANAVK